MSPAEVLPVLKQMAAALDAAHAAGVIHRDFKTSNVILVPPLADNTHSAGMRVVVTDFGIARALRPEPSSAEKVTGTGLLGTPVYMAPEQVTGGEVGPAADIYALGVVLYEMLTGTTPFAGASPLETAVKRLNERPEPPKARVPELGERWNTAVLKCLERDPARRFSTASEVERFVERPVVMVRRRSVLSMAAAGLALILLLLAGAAWFGGWFGIRKDERWLRTEVIPELHRLVERCEACSHESGW
jgi:serine/threonine protein kinase